MRPVYINQAACVTALGTGLPALWGALIEGRSGIVPLDRFCCDNYISQLAACIDDLERPAGGSRLDPLLERIAAQLAAVPPDTRLLLASTKGEIDRFEAAGRAAEPLPQAVLFEALLDKVARRFGLRDAGMNINAACASSTVALARGAALIASGAADSVLVYAADLVSNFVFSGFSALQALSGEPCRPFDRRRLGLNLGEAGVALHLTGEAHTGSQPLGMIAGWGAANDAHHVTAPARDGSGLILACRAALERARIDHSQIAAINAHGTATLYNDAMELTAFTSLFGEELPPMHGIKGSLGHCLGAAGALEVLVAAQALRERQIPGTVGCEEPEEAAGGRISTGGQSIDGDYLLTTNSGFGGVNAALVLQRGTL